MTLVWIGLGVVLGSVGLYAGIWLYLFRRYVR